MGLNPPGQGTLPSPSKLVRRQVKRNSSPVFRTGNGSLDLVLVTVSCSLNATVINVLGSEEREEPDLDKLSKQICFALSVG